MKVVFSSILISLLCFGSCGKKTTNLNNSKEEIEDSIDSKSDYLSVVISVPNPSALGGATSITLNNKDYLIGDKTTTWIQNEIRSWQQGSYSKKIKGSLAREFGYFPNPTVEWDVIHISDLKD